MFYAKFGWNWPSGSREENENVKSLRQRRRRRIQWQQRRRRTTDKLWSEKLTWAFGSGELKLIRNLILKSSIQEELPYTCMSFTDSDLKIKIGTRLYIVVFLFWSVNDMYYPVPLFVWGFFQGRTLGGGEFHATKWQFFGKYQLQGVDPGHYPMWSRF